MLARLSVVLFLILATFLAEIGSASDKQGKFSLSCGWDAEHTWDCPIIYQSGSEVIVLKSISLDSSYKNEDALPLIESAAAREMYLLQSASLEQNFLRQCMDLSASRWLDYSPKIGVNVTASACIQVTKRRFE